MTSSEAQGRLARIEVELADATTHLEVLTLLEARFRAQLRDLDPYTADPGEQRQQDSLNTTLRQLHHGVKRTDGLWFPEELAPIIDKPGLAQTRSTIERLQRERDECHAFLQRWPDREERHRFRYTGRRYKHVHGGHRLETGDVVELTQDQAHAWRDRFEPATDDEPVTDLTERPLLPTYQGLTA